MVYKEVRFSFKLIISINLKVSLYEIIKDGNVITGPQMKQMHYQIWKFLRDLFSSNEVD